MSLVLPETIITRTSAGNWTTTTTAGAASSAARRRWDRILSRAHELTPAPGALVARPVAMPLRIVDERPNEALWDRTVGLFAGAVGRGRIDKVVLARRVVMEAPADLDVENALRRLAASAPESTIFAFRRDARTFLGATPERLIRTDGREFRTVAIAGSIGRGADAAADAVLAADLLDSDKDREEHAVVVAALRERLSPICERLVIDPEVRVLTLRHVQHLVTDIEGTVHERLGLLALAERLHPTPAVGGEPRDVALGLIDEHEGFDRGWYAGPIGWIGPEGDGDLMVALRSGIVERTRVTLFAGCGIVADSDPDREWDESRMKLRAVAAALGRPGDEP
jgi:isochorismate synthase